MRVHPMQGCLPPCGKSIALHPPTSFPLGKRGSGFQSSSPSGPTKYTHLDCSLKMLRLPLFVPQFWGETEVQSPPNLGDLGGEIAGKSLETTYVYTVAVRV